MNTLSRSFTIFLINFSVASILVAGLAQSQAEEVPTEDYYTQTIETLQQQYRYLASKIEHMTRKKVIITDEDLDLTLQYITTCNDIKYRYNDVPLVVIAFYIIEKVTARKNPNESALLVFRAHSCNHPIAGQARSLLERRNLLHHG